MNLEYLSKPTSADIKIAIDKAVTGDWIDPDRIERYWYAELRDPDGIWFWNGCADTAAEAMALAWLHCWAPDALIDGYVEPESVPLEIPDGWLFRLTEVDDE
jgi:hypothetical protein